MGFLRWWFMVCVSLVVCVLSLFFGWAEKLWTLDVTKISLGIVIVYFLSTAFTGWLTYLAENIDSFGNKKATKKKINSNLKFSWYSAELMLGLGMIGTMIGIMVMLTSIRNSVDPTMIITGLKSGLATVGITTIVGLACSFALKAQLVNIEHLTHE